MKRERGRVGDANGRQPVVAAVFASATLVALACGTTSDGKDDADTKDAAGDTMAESRADTGLDVVDVPESPMPRCAGATYTTAPSGAACDPKRIEHAKGLEGTCYGPALGARCDRLQVDVPSDDGGVAPSGFVCQPSELGFEACEWTFADETHTIDEDALEAACAMTLSFPTAIVRCVKFGS